MRADEMETPGMLDTAGLELAIGEGSIDTVILAFPDPCGRLLGKRLNASFSLTDMAGGTHLCDYLFTVDMEMQPVHGYEFANWDRGYGDVRLVPDVASMRKLARLDRTAPVICDAELESEHQPVAVAPRSMLRKQPELLADRNSRPCPGPSWSATSIGCRTRRQSSMAIKICARPNGTLRITSFCNRPAPMI